MRLVPVSRPGAPASCPPGTGLRTGLGAGGGGGRIASGSVGREALPAAVTTEIGPVTAPTGTRAWRRVSLPGRTSTPRSSPLPKLPWNTTWLAPVRLVPLILTVLPPWARWREAQRRRHETLVTFGLAT